jgi:hypothetical protein
MTYVWSIGGVPSGRSEIVCVVRTCLVDRVGEIQLGNKTRENHLGKMCFASGRVSGTNARDDSRELKRTRPRRIAVVSFRSAVS